MKKNNIFYACAAAALVFASCQKETPAVEGPQQAPSTLSEITATTLSTKTTTLDGVNVLWEDGDKIHLFTRTLNEGTSKFDASWCDYETTLDSPSATATFVIDETNTKTVDNTSGKYLAVHYKGASVVTQSRDYNAQFVLLPSQVAKNGGDFTATLMAATSENAEFQFSHLVSYVKFTVDNNSTPFNKITVTPVNASEKVITRIKIDWVNDLTVTVLSGHSQDSRSVSLVTDDNTDFAPGTYYLAVNPNTYADGLCFTFENADGQTCDKTTPANVVMKAGDVANMGTVGTLEFPDAPVTPSALGTVYAENGENLGVVFWVDHENPAKGKIISGATTNVAWYPGSKDLSDEMDTYLTGDYTIAEKFEFVKAASDYTEQNYPAVYFCDNLGEGWRLPHRDELKEMLQVYWGVETLKENTDYNVDANSLAMNKFDGALAQCITDDPNTSYDETKINYGTPSATVNYWTGHARLEALPSTRIFRVNMAPKFVFESYANPTNVQYVRCVRDVELQ